MKISVVIPTYNSGPLVVEAVNSVLAQTRPADEIVVVDDGSTDDTAERVTAFGPPVRYLRKENGGVATARNRGIAAATGDLVAFLDADDVWHPRKLELQVPTLLARPDLALLGTRVYDWPGEQPEAGADAPLTIIRLADLVVRNCLATSSILVRKSALDTAGPFDVRLRGPEDHDLWIRVAKSHGVARLEQPLAGYRHAQPGSLAKNAAQMEAGMRMILQKLEGEMFFANRPVLRRKARGYFHYSCGYMHLRGRDRGKAAAHLLSSFWNYPAPFGRSEVRHLFGRVRLLARALLKG